MGCNCNDNSTNMAFAQRASSPNSQRYRIDGPSSIPTSASVKSNQLYTLQVLNGFTGNFEAIPNGVLTNCTITWIIANFGSNMSLCENFSNGSCSPSGAQFNGDRIVTNKAFTNVVIDGLALGVVQLGVQIDCPPGDPSTPNDVVNPISIALVHGTVGIDYNDPFGTNKPSGTPACPPFQIIGPDTLNPGNIGRYTTNAVNDLNTYFTFEINAPGWTAWTAFGTYGRKFVDILAPSLIGAARGSSTEALLCVTRYGIGCEPTKVCKRITVSTVTHVNSSGNIFNIQPGIFTPRTRIFT